MRVYQAQPHLKLVIVMIALHFSLCGCGKTIKDDCNILCGNGLQLGASAVIVSHQPEKNAVAKNMFFGTLLGGSIHMKPIKPLDINEPKLLSARGLGKTRFAEYRPGFGVTLLPLNNESGLTPKKLELPPAPTPPELPPGTLHPYFQMKLDEAIDYAFREPLPWPKLRRTRAVVVVHKGKVVAEKYAKGYGPQTKILGWSMAKTAMNALYGILVKEGIVTLNDKVHAKEWEGLEQDEITFENMLKMQSGIVESGGYKPDADLGQMLYLAKDMAEYGAKEKYKSGQTGKYWEYNNGTTNILSRAIKERLGEAAYFTFPYEKFFYKIGMSSALWQTDAVNTFVGSSYIYATARDWARLGLFFLKGGKDLQGECLVQPGWVAKSCIPVEESEKKAYGMHLWTNAAKADPSLPIDMFMAKGFEAQVVAIVPTRELVIVRLGKSILGFDTVKFLEKVMAAFPMNPELHLPPPETEQRITRRLNENHVLGFRRRRWNEEEKF